MACWPRFNYPAFESRHNFHSNGKYARPADICGGRSVRQEELTADFRCVCTSEKQGRSPERPLSSNCPIQFAAAAKVRSPPFMSKCAWCSICDYQPLVSNDTNGPKAPTSLASCSVLHVRRPPVGQPHPLLPVLAPRRGSRRRPTSRHRWRMAFGMGTLSVGYMSINGVNSSTPNIPATPQRQRRKRFNVSGLIWSMLVFWWCRMTSI